MGGFVRPSCAPATDEAEATREEKHVEKNFQQPRFASHVRTPPEIENMNNEKVVSIYLPGERASVQLKFFSQALVPLRPKAKATGDCIKISREGSIIESLESLEAGLPFLLPLLVAALLFWSSESVALGYSSKFCFLSSEWCIWGVSAQFLDIWYM
jgi:hypothetical protein